MDVQIESGAGVSGIAKLTERQFEERLKAACEDIDPEHLVVELGKLYRQYGGVSRQPIVLAPFQVARMIAATSAYSQPDRAMAATAERINRVHGLLSEYSSEYVSRVVEQRDLARMIIALFGQQVLFQYDMQQTDRFRTVHILWESERVAPYSNEIEKAVGGTIPTLMVFYTLLELNLGREPRGMLDLKEFSPLADAAFKHLDWRGALDRITMPIPKLGREYVRTRDAIGFDDCKGLGQSELLKRPVLEIGGRYRAAPIPELIGRWVALELEDSLKRQDENMGHAIRMAYQDYVELWLRDTGVFGHVMPEAKIPHRQGDKVCDLLCQAEDSIVLVEVKSSNSLPRYVVAETLRDHTLVSKVCEGIEQICAMGTRLRADDVEGIRLGARRLYGFVVVLGELPNINNAFGMGELIGPTYDKRKGCHRSDMQVFDDGPQVLDNRAFEGLCAFMSNKAVSLPEMFARRSEYSHDRVGDWRGLVMTLRGDSVLRYPEFVLDGIEVLRAELDEVAGRMKAGVQRLHANRRT